MGWWRGVENMVDKDKVTRQWFRKHDCFGMTSGWQCHGLVEVGIGIGDVSDFVEST